jgi:hypothetical protein
VADFQGGMGGESPGPREKLSIKTAGKSFLEGPLPKGNNENPQAQKLKIRH